MAAVAPRGWISAHPSPWFHIPEQVLKTGFHGPFSFKQGHQPAQRATMLSPSPHLCWVRDRGQHRQAGVRAAGWARPPILGESPALAATRPPLRAPAMHQPGLGSGGPGHTSGQRQPPPDPSLSSLRASGTAFEALLTLVPFFFLSLNDWTQLSPFIPRKGTPQRPPRTFRDPCGRNL